MEGSSIEQFIEKLRTDDALRQRVVEAESAAARDINRGTDAITQLAAQEGFDISGWPGRPITEGPAAAEESDFGCCTPSPSNSTAPWTSTSCSPACSTGS